MLKLNRLEHYFDRKTGLKNQEDFKKKEKKQANFSIKAKIT